MNGESIISKIDSLQIHLAIVKAELKQSRAGAPSRSAADLYGISADQSDTSEQDIEAVKYRFPFDDAEADGAPA